MTIKVETLGSFWWIDPVTKTYRRSPKVERPRWRPEWGDERAGRLQDFVVHPYVFVRVSYMPFDEDCEWDGCSCCPHLQIMTPDGKRSIYAPNLSDADIARVREISDAHLYDL